MKTVRNRVISDYYDFPQPQIIENVEFIACRFICCDFAAVETPLVRSRLRNAKFENCSCVETVVGPAIFDNVVIDNLDTEPLFEWWGTVFRKVTLRGQFSHWTFWNAPPYSSQTEQVQAFAATQQEFYSQVDWALDIRHAEFQSCEIQGIPSRLIRRDVETQMVISRAKAQENDWRNLRNLSLHWHVRIEGFLRSGDTDRVLVAPKRNPEFDRLLGDLQKLHEIGVLE